MVDVPLPSIRDDARPLRVMFLDLNAYFASAEQQDRPELRGKPVGVVPVEADTSFIIAASYEAKRFGVRTGTQIREAKNLCPEITLVKARPPLYVHFHNKVIEAAESVLPVDKVCSIDEMRFRLIGDERSSAVAMELARRMKKAIRESAGECLTCSIGIAPNSFLAKLASDMQKPDGLVVLHAEELEARMKDLVLTDFAGINKKMEVRLNAAGVFTAEQMYALSRRDLRAAFGSIVGERWWYLLRGYEVATDDKPPQSLGHSHVLAPALRTDDGCREVLLRLLHKAASRLRASQLWACEMDIFVSGFKKSWSAHLRLPPTQDTVTMAECLASVWPSRDFESPRSVGVTFRGIHPEQEVTPSLFESTAARSRFSHALDSINQKFGKNTIYLASMEAARDAAPERIAFDKTWLFSEGKDDNIWSE